MQSCRGCWGGTVYCQGNQIWKHLRGNWKKEQLQELLSCFLLMFVATMWKHLQGWTYSWFPWWCLTRPWLVCQLLLTKRRGRSTVGLSYGKMVKKRHERWQTHQGMQNFFWYFLNQDSISGLSGAVLGECFIGIAMASHTWKIFAFDKAGRFHNRLLLWLPKLSDGNIDWAAAEECI